MASKRKRQDASIAATTEDDNEVLNSVLDKNDDEDFFKPVPKNSNDNQEEEEEEEDDVYVSDDDGMDNDNDAEASEDVLSLDPLHVSSDEDKNDDDEDDGVQVLESFETTTKAKPKKPSLFADAEHSDDSSEDEGQVNTIGNVPLQWYEEYDHIGYDKEGKKIKRKPRKDLLDHLIARHDDPNYIKTIYDEYNDKEVTLTNEDLKLLVDVQKNRFPKGYTPYREYIDYVKYDSRFPLIGNTEPKANFIPNKHEQKIINEIADRMKRGLIPYPSQVKKQRKQEQVYLLWGEDGNVEGDIKKRDILQPPKLALPGHGDSYNPPAEYRSDKNPGYESLRAVPRFDDALKDAFERCLDLYMAPRVQVVKKLIKDPDALLPELPKPEELRPFPEIQSLVFDGHTDIVRKISVDPTGKWLASASCDFTVRLWETDTGRCTRIWTFTDEIQWAEWNPNPKLNLLAVATETFVYLIQPPESGNEDSNAMTVKLFPAKNFANTSNADDMPDDVIIEIERQEAEDKEDVQEELDVEAKSKRGKKIQLLKWNFYRKEEHKQQRQQGILARLDHMRKVTQVTWHYKGDYFASLSPLSYNDAIVIHQVSTRQSQKPFSKPFQLKGQHFTKIMFHPSKPLFFVVLQRSIRVYNLLKQRLWKRMKNQKCRYISSLDVHPHGGHIICGGFDKRMEWYDLELSAQPYKTLRYHDRAVRGVAFHKRYPLFATCSDDGTIRVFHSSVFDDWTKEPMIVPLKILKGHGVTSYSLGVMDIAFHPTQPWLFSAGADTTIRLYTS